MEQSRMTQDDVLFGYRLQLFDLAARTTVAHACRTFGVHRSTYYRWKRQVERHGLEVLRPRERRRPRMPNQLSPLVEQRIVAFALGQPGLGPRRIAAELARPRWGGLLVSANGVWRCLCRHGLSTRAKRLALVAGYAAPYEPPRPAPIEQHVEAERPGELVGFDCFFVGRLHNMKETVWQLTAIDVCSSYAWAELVSCKRGQPSAAQTSKLAERVAAELRAAGWRLERAPTEQRKRVSGRPRATARGAGRAHDPDPRRPTADKRCGRGRAQNDSRRVLAPHLRPLPAGPLPGPAPRPRRLPALLQLRARPHRPTHPLPGASRHRLRCPQDGGEMSRTCRHISE